jgi:hypothetical protein
MEYTDNELNERIANHQKNLEHLKSQKSNIDKTIKLEKEQLDRWVEIKKSKQIKLF